MRCWTAAACACASTARPRRTWCRLTSANGWRRGPGPISAPLKRRDCTEAELYWQTRACGANDWYYLDGRLYPCARIACAVALGALREGDCAFAEVRRARGRRQVARDLERLTQPRPMEACRYCLRGTAAFTAVACEARTKLRQEGE